MNRFLLVALCATAAAFAIAAQAAEPTSPNGGTGYIGLAASAGMAAQRMPLSRADRMPAGEASTWVAGQPNGNPEAPHAGAAMAASPMAGERTMGAAPAPRMTRPAPTTWGTPD